jgi:hypothetical protein
LASSGDALLLAAPEIGTGPSCAAVLDGSGARVGVVRGAVDDDPEQVVVVAVEPLRRLLPTVSAAGEDHAATDAGLNGSRP